MFTRVLYVILNFLIELSLAAVFALSFGVISGELNFGSESMSALSVSAYKFTGIGWAVGWIIGIVVIPLKFFNKK